jgi:hypothetical protein
MATFDSTTAQIMQQQRRQQLAQMLLQQGIQEQPTQMAGNIAIRQSPLSGLVRGLMAYQGMKGLNESDQAITDIATKREQADDDALNQGMALLNQGDRAGAMKAFSSTPKGQAYAAELMKSNLDQEAQRNKPLDLGDVSKFTPESVSKFQQSKNYADLVPAGPTDYQNADLKLRQQQVNQGQWQLDHDAMGNPIRVNKVSGETQPIKTEGSATGVDLQNMIDGIGTGKIAPPSSLALRNPKVLQMMDMVMQKYPDYDGTIYATRQSAQKSWAPGGKSGDTYRAIGTANKHLDMVSNLVDALDNKNLQLANKLGNEYSKQTGNPAPTNFDAAKNIVGQEVVKAIVANGGGVAEREEAAKLLDKAQSPAQLKGVINTYRTIMGAQKESLLQQRRAAGLSDKTLPDYTEGVGSNAPATGRFKIEVVP